MTHKEQAGLTDAVIERAVDITCVDPNRAAAAIEAHIRTSLNRTLQGI